MPRFYQTPLTPQEIQRTAQAAVRALEENGLECCLFGSTACAIYGMENREPNDVDIVVLTEIQTEELKDLILETDDNFYLIPSRDPNATHRVLWYALSSLEQPHLERKCKVDILVPGLLSIPRVPSQHIMYSENFPDIPLMPLLPLILLKLRGWSDHRVDEREYMQEKVPQDEVDIEEMLQLAVEEYDVHIRKEKWLPEWFIREAKERVGLFAKELPGSEAHWRDLGFFVS
ncbi:hypothetical protein BDQ12DRAFT_77027 [Crucibulum laeve]|uniref:Uncharacterized protein n=1 Tax=Crucibulum laeve TaxID=68775 RepID=A0A5C3M260_9AGAR|nr:hypothetical protein BDQ12DRAFT_77027 [Crucibulum laeve]